MLGLSGGIDSALTAALAVDALGKDKVVGVAMPSRFSSEHSVDDAKALAENLGIEFHIVPIKPIHDAYEQIARTASSKAAQTDVTEENLQARIRGALLMAFSNKFNHLLLTTGNKSEIAVGYCTLYGDMCGGLAVISDVPKTTVYELSQFINVRGRPRRDPAKQHHQSRPAPSCGRTRPTRIRCHPTMCSMRSCIEYVEEEKSAGQIIAEGFDEATVMRIIKPDRPKRIQATTGGTGDQGHQPRVWVWTEDADRAELRSSGAQAWRGFAGAGMKYGIMPP